MAKKINTEMELRKVKLSDLVPYENNPRNNDEAVPDVEESMVQTGYNSPIVVSKDMVILAGHTRLKSLLDAGVEEAPVVVIDRTAEQQKKFRLLDNKTGEKASWDFEKLKFELDGLDFDGFDFDFSDGETGGGVTEMPMPENLDGEDYDGNQSLAVKITFPNYTAYSMYEDELKEMAARMGAEFSVVKA